MPRHRRRFDDDDLDLDLDLTATASALGPGSAPGTTTVDPDDQADDAASVLPFGDRWSSYPIAARGPSPVPAWVITVDNAVDTDLGVLKTGKEADVSLVERVDLDHGRSGFMAAKRYRDADHRLFHRDAGYLEGRRVRRSREMRAMQHRTRFGRTLLAGQWAFAEFEALGRLWSAGLPVPYPVSFDGDELLMEFIGDDDGVAAPRLAACRATDRTELVDWFGQCRAALLHLARLGFAHGDLSAFNVLVDGGRIVLIDLPQIVDIAINPQGREYLRRDVENLCTWFEGQGLAVDTGELMRELLAELP